MIGSAGVTGKDAGWAVGALKLPAGMMAVSPCPIEVMKRAVDRMYLRGLLIGYGMTETSTATATDDPIERRVSTVGRALPHVEVKIVDVAGRIGSATAATSVPKTDPQGVAFVLVIVHRLLQHIVLR